MLLEWQSNRYAQVLAQDTPRKKALLIGINDYGGNGNVSDWPSLRRVVTDVKLQHELLTHRFGLKANDIWTLKDSEASRSKILMRLKELIQWAKQGNVVVVHYSVHGSTVFDLDRVQGEWMGTIVL